MSYKLNKNLLFAALVWSFVLSSAKVQAQGAVTLVVDEDEASSDNALPSSEATDVSDSNALITPPVSVEVPAAPADNAAQAGSNEAFSLDLNNQELPSTASAPSASANATPAAASGVVTATAPVAATAQATAVAPKPEPEPLPKSEPKFGETLLSAIDNDLFNQMSDIEKQTTLLTLELRRERLRSEIEAIKEQRAKAFEEKMEAQAEKKRKELEWQKEQEAKVLREQQALKDKEIMLERLKQRKALNKYMNLMLEQNQKWIAENSKLYKKIRSVEDDRRAVTEDFKGKLDSLKNLADKSVQTATDAKNSYDRTVANYTAQLDQLRKRLEAEELAKKNREQNPFAEEGGATTGANGASVSGIDLQIAPIEIAKEYAILDISGQGDVLTAKLINKDGQSFQVREGTVLQTGHTVEHITKNFIEFDKNGLKDYLYTSVTATEIEPQAFVETPAGGITVVPQAQTPRTTKAPAPRTATKPKGLVATKGNPSLGNGMFIK